MTHFDFGLTSYGLALAAGTLSTLSPCVLPLIPILLGSTLSNNRLAPVALGSGLAISFATTGTAVASLGQILDFDPGSLHPVSAALLVIFGLVLLSTRLQQRFASATSGIGNFGNRWASTLNPEGIHGQFLLGFLLGIAWSPCVGPTLGIAIGLASQGKHVMQVAIVMLFFGLGAALPIIGLGLLSNQGMRKIRGNLLLFSGKGKQILGFVMLVIGVMILTGMDKLAETKLLTLTPDWLLKMTTTI